MSLALFILFTHFIRFHQQTKQSEEGHMPGRVVCESSPQPPGQLKLRNTHWFVSHMHYLLPHILTFKVVYYTLHSDKSNICQPYVFETVTDSKKKRRSHFYKVHLLYKLMHQNGKCLHNIMPHPCKSSGWGSLASLWGPGLSEFVLWKVEAEILGHETDCWFQSWCTMSSLYISQNKIKKHPRRLSARWFFIGDSL